MPLKVMFLGPATGLRSREAVISDRTSLNHKPKSTVLSPVKTRGFAAETVGSNVITKRPALSSEACSNHSA